MLKKIRGLVARIFQLALRDDLNGHVVAIDPNFAEITASDLIHQLGKLRDAFAHDLQPLRAQSIQLDADFFSTSIQGARCIA